MKTIRVGMIGAGAIAGDHCAGINKHPQARVTCVADVSQERAEALQKEYRLDRTYARWEDLVADKDLDAVSIALPTFLHAPVAIAALRAGKHVLLDKPFALNLAEARKVAQAARKSRKVFMLGMNWRFQKSTQTIKTIVQRGELGDIYHARACWWRRKGSPRFGTWFCQKQLSGGGCTLDIGVHMLDACLYVMDNWQPVSVSGSVYTKFGNRGLGEGGWGKSDRGKPVFDVEDYTSALIKFRNGATVDLGVSWACHMESGNKSGVELFGTEAGAGIVPPRIFRNGKKPGEYEVVEPQNVPIAWPHANRFINWIDSILGKDKPACTLEQSLTVQAILDGIYKSSRTRREVRL